MSMAPALDLLDFAGIDETDAEHVRAAIQRSDNFQGYIPSDALDFIVRNYRVLVRLRALELAWLDSYAHSLHFSVYGIETIRTIFDACARERLLMLEPRTQIAKNAQRCFVPAPCRATCAGFCRQALPEARGRRPQPADRRATA